MLLLLRRIALSSQTLQCSRSAYHTSGVGRRYTRPFDCPTAPANACSATAAEHLARSRLPSLRLAHTSVSSQPYAGAQAFSPPNLSPVQPASHINEMYYGWWNVRMTSSVHTMALTVPCGDAASQGCPHAKGAATVWPTNYSVVVTSWLKQISKRMTGRHRCLPISRMPLKLSNPARLIPRTNSSNSTSRRHRRSRKYIKTSKYGVQRRLRDTGPTSRRSWPALVAKGCTRYAAVSVSIS